MEYLLFLQGLREGALGFLTPFLSVMSEYWATICPLIVALVFWGIDKKVGERMYFAFGASYLINGIVKLCACIYRPWIINPDIHPDPLAVKGATGYSFPSGHATVTGPSVAYPAYKFRKKIAVPIVMGILIVLNLFARNFLGLHTLWDVVVGFLIGIVTIVAAEFLFNWLDKHPEKDWIVLAVSIAAAAGTALFAILKNDYPMDYDAAHNLIVDPREMTPDTFGGVGIMTGWVIGWFLERRFVKFDDKVKTHERIVRMVIGLGLYALVYLVIMKKLTAPMEPNFGKFLCYFVSFFFSSFIYPLIMKLLSNIYLKKKATKSTGETQNG